MTLNPGEDGKKKNRGWWNRARAADGEIIDLEPTKESLEPSASHWQLLVSNTPSNPKPQTPYAEPSAAHQVSTIKALKAQAEGTGKDGGQMPSWAYAIRGEGGRLEAKGPVVASQVKTVMLATAKRAGGGFVEQELGFKNFSHFLDTAVAPLGTLYVGIWGLGLGVWSLGG